MRRIIIAILVSLLSPVVLAQNVTPPEGQAINPQASKKIQQEMDAQPLPHQSLDKIPSPMNTQPTSSGPIINSQPSVMVSKPNLPQRPTTESTFLIENKGHYRLNFDDADIYSVIQTVFDNILHVNYIVDSRVKGRVTFRSVTPVPKEKVLPLMEVILRLNGVAIIEESDLYRIIPISDVSREPSEIKIGRKIDEGAITGKALIQIVPLNNVQSSEMIKLIEPFVSASAVIVDVPKANHVIVVDTDVNVQRILHLIEYFDAEAKEKKGVRVFVHHVQNAQAKDLVSVLQQIYTGAKAQTAEKPTGRLGTAAPSPRQLVGRRGTALPSQSQQPQTVTVEGHPAGANAVVSDVVKIFADEKLNAIVILGTQEDYNVIKETILKLDIVPRQVLIEGTIASIQLTDQLSLGLAWSLKTNAFDLNPVNISFNPSSLDVNPAKPTASGLNVIGVDSHGVVRAVINALASQSKATLLASPQVMVSDNKEARIQVGQQVPIPTSETFATADSLPQRTIQYKDIGIILTVKPIINDSGLVTLQIAQEISTYSTIVLYSNEKQIILNKTEVSTNLVVKDGHTIVIGGLIREDDSKGKAGIPCLGKIPILEYLFGNTTKDKTRTELVILLTPSIVKNEVDTTAVTDEVTRKLSDKKMIEELQKNIHKKPDSQGNVLQKKE